MERHAEPSRKKQISAVNIQLKSIQKLVEELIKKKPREYRIKVYMKSVGLAYSKNEADRINTVLQVLHGQTGPVEKSS